METAIVHGGLHRDNGKPKRRGLNRRGLRFELGGSSFGLRFELEGFRL